MSLSKTHELCVELVNTQEAVALYQYDRKIVDQNNIKPQSKQSDYSVFYSLPEEWSADEDQSTPRNQEEIDNRLHTDSDALEVLETEKNSGTVKADTENQSVDGSKNIPALNEEKSETQSTTLKNKDTGQSDDVQTKIDKNTDTDNDETKTDGTNAIEKESVTETSKPMEKDKVAESESVEKDKTTESATISVDSDKVPMVSKDSVDGKVCDKEDIVGEEAELKTRVKGDMVVVGTERISPSSDLSGTGTKGLLPFLVSVTVLITFKEFMLTNV